MFGEKAGKLEEELNDVKDKISFACENRNREEAIKEILGYVDEIEKIVSRLRSIRHAFATESKKMKRAAEKIL